MSDNEVDPIAWVRANGNVVTRLCYSHPDPEIPTVFNGFMEHSSSVHQPYLDQLPADAVPLVPATELGRQYCDCREWLSNRRCQHVANSAQLPALDTPEALRYAASVAEARGLFNSAEEMNGIAHRQERAAAVAREEAERQARIEKLAVALHSNQPYVWGQKWEHLNSTDKAAIVESASALDDLGYRLDPSQAKAAS